MPCAAGEVCTLPNRTPGPAEVYGLELLVTVASEAAGICLNHPNESVEVRATGIWSVAFHVLYPYLKKIGTHLDLLSIPRLGGKKMSKRLGGIKGCKYKTSSWHLNGFPYGGTIGSIV